MALASTLARDWVLDVQNESDAWTNVKGLTAVSPIFEGSEQDATTIDDEGYGSSIVTGLAFRIEGSGKRSAVAGTDDPGQDVLRRKGRKTGEENFVNARIYRRDALPDAYSSQCTVKWTDSAASDPNALQEFSFTLSGNGKPEEIAKPTSTLTTKTFTVTGAPAGGTWTVTADSNTTGVLSRTISRLAFQSALEALPNVGEGNVTVTGDSAATGYTAVFSVTLTTVTAAHTFTGGTTPGVTVA
jgi:hypothetical protein